MLKSRFVLQWFRLGLFALLSKTALGQDTPAPTTSASLKIAILTDTIDQVGWDRPNGYLHLIDAAAKDQDRMFTIIKAGVGANVSTDLLNRLKKDVLDQKPDYLALHCGGNDALRNIPLDKFTANVTAIADQSGGAGIKVIIMTATMLGEDPNNPANQKLAPYNDALRQIAKAKNLPLLDLSDEMQAQVAQLQGELRLPKPGNLLTTDGTHLNGLGQEMIAAALLQALGFTPAQLAQERDLWLDQPTGMDLPVHGTVSARQFMELRGLAASEGTTVDDMLARTLSRDVQVMLTDPSGAKQAATKKK